MAYTQLTLSPVTIQYARDLGGKGLHFGILGALPVAMLFMQFVAAVLANHLHFRRGVWLSVSLFQRIALVPVACGPLCFEGLSDAFWIWALVFATAANHAMLHFCMPLWLSWMGDYLPREGLNRFWGIRQLWMQWAGAAALFGGAMFLRESGLDIRPAFAVLMIAGAMFGLADILIFLKIEEPPVERLPEPSLRKVLSAPFLNRDFRTFISYWSFWHLAAMAGAPFISLFLLDRIGMTLFQLLLLWTFSWVGGAMFAKRLGHAAETFGNRPMLILCTAFKSVNMIALLLTPTDPSTAFWVLVPVFMVDSVLNTGLAIATNGFMLKNSPSQNRTMYLAAGTAVAGLVGGTTSIAAGAMLSVVGYQVLFATSVVLRLISILFAARVREPDSHSTTVVFGQLIGVTPTRMFRFPVGLYRQARKLRSDGDDEAGVQEEAA